MPRSAHTSTRRRPSELGTIERLPSGRYRAFYRIDGEKFAAPHTFDTKDAAAAWLVGERADRARGLWHGASTHTPTLAEFADAYLATAALAPRTVHNYRFMIGRYMDADLRTRTGRTMRLGAIPLDEITPPLVRAWHAAVRDAAAGAAPRPRRMPPLHPARAWASAAGLNIKPTGVLPAAVLDAWRKAGSPAAPARELPPLDRAPHTGLATAARAYRVLRMLCNVALSDGVLTENPCRIKAAGSDRAAERPVATPAEVDQLAALMPPRLAVAVTVAAWSGLRRGELFALARRHIDLTTGNITVERALLDLPGQPLGFTTPKTAKSARTVHLPQFVLAALRAHLDQHVPDDPDALVFATATGRPLTASNVAVPFRRARIALDRPELHWHDLRHTGATLAYQAGASVPEVQRRLGHTTMRAAQIYAHAAADSDRVLAARLDAMFAPAEPAPRLRAITG
jgi:integrase